LRLGQNPLEIASLLVPLNCIASGFPQKSVRFRLNDSAGRDVLEALLGVCGWVSAALIGNETECLVTLRERHHTDVLAGPRAKQESEA